ncbi:NADH-ubiquinone oxidoreductase complex I, 21 kDa subunit-domain-containing protein [Gorgonomyces haynaldii]|nr:NADH-ubiquinone oxidoreductase complex I, 21 kDa subunit-domain-containing protein [Gorgonomyces haynaldii]
MVQWVSNLPKGNQVPYPLIKDQPHIKQVVSYFRGSDYLALTAIGLGGPAVLLAWERFAPTVHPKRIPGLMAIQIPFFVTCGFLYASQRSLFRFWGWSENAREVEKWNNEPASIRDARPQDWGSNDW